MSTVWQSCKPTILASPMRLYLSFHKSGTLSAIYSFPCHSTWSSAQSACSLARKNLIPSRVAEFYIASNAIFWTMLLTLISM